MNGHGEQINRKEQLVDILLERMAILNNSLAFAVLKLSYVSDLASREQYQTMKNTCEQKIIDIEYCLAWLDTVISVRDIPPKKTQS